jgi:hypothetical protein
MKKIELKTKLHDFTLEEIAAAYELFNPEFFDSRLYDIPTTMDGWVEQILEDINVNGYCFEDIFCEEEAR